MNIVNKLTLRHLRLNKGRSFATLLGIVLSVAMVCAVAGYIYSYFDFAYRSLEESSGDWHVSFDNIPREAAEQLVQDEVFDMARIEETKGTVTDDDGKPIEGLVDVTVRFKLPVRNFNKLKNELYTKYDLSPRTDGISMSMAYNNQRMELDGIRTGDFGMAATIYLLAGILIVIISVCTVIVISNGFLISTTDRIRQFGLLKSAGATSKQIMHSVLFEAFALAIIGIPLGILLGFSIQGGSLAILNKVLTDAGIVGQYDLDLRIVFKPAILIITTAAAAATVLVSAWIPARRAAMTPAIQSIRQSRGVRVRGREFRVSPVTAKLFGFEGVLASKSLKRSRGKYRSAVASLTVSIVLFIAASSFMGMLGQASMQYISDESYNVSVTTYDSVEWQDEVNAWLLARDDISFQTCRNIRLMIYFPEDFYTDDYRQWLGERHSGSTTAVYGSRLVSIPDAEFEKLAPNARGEVPGVVVNTTETLLFKGRRTAFVPFHVTPGEDIHYQEGFTQTENGEFPENITLTVTIAGETDQSFYPNSWIGGATILIPESVYRKTAALPAADRWDISADVFITAEDSAQFCADMRNAFPQTEGRTIYITDREQQRRQERTVLFCIALFGYGFVGLLSAIAVISVITSISTGMALRRQEFAMLYSVGMTNQGMNKMLSLESLLYGLKALIFGIPLGVGVTYAAYKAFQRGMDFPYVLPWLAVLICAAAVFLITFATMRYGKRKYKRMNIVEALRSEIA